MRITVELAHLVRAGNYMWTGGGMRSVNSLLVIIDFVTKIVSLRHRRPSWLEHTVH